MVTSVISLHLSVSRPNFAVLPNEGCQWFCIFCRHKSGNRDKPTILNTLTTVLEYGVAEVVETVCISCRTAGVRPQTQH